VCSEKSYNDESWYNSDWGSNVVAHVVGPPETSPQIDPKSCYSAEMCRQVAKAQGYNINGKLNFTFTGDYKTKGCYVYGPNSQYELSAFYG
jgi:hypothetical protein